MKSLFKEFKKSSKKEWLAKVEKDLKGKPMEGLMGSLNDEIKISPFAHADDRKGNFPPLTEKRKSNTWEKGVRIVVSNFKTGNREAMALLENGASAICFEFKNNPTQKDLVILLKDIQHEWISTHFILPSKSWKKITSDFISILKNKKQNLKNIACSFQFKDGTTIPPSDFKSVQELAQELPLVNLITINSRNFSKKKKSTIEELAQAISLANNYLEKWNDKNLDLKNLISTLQFSIELNDSYYLNIAKVRALKLLWTQVVKAWKSSLNPTTVIETHLTSSTQTKDENYNKIKATSQAMSAVIGGTQRLYIYPSDSFKNKKGTQNQNRLGLNIQNLMELESYMDRVVDPAAGSYFLENLTETLAEEAWEVFSKK